MRTKSTILPDVNVLVDAHNADSAVHERLAAGGRRSGAECVELAWAVILGFLRITTNRKVVARPFAVRDVMQRFQAWLALPQVHVAQPSESHFTRLRAELERLGTAANLTVLGMERGFVLFSTDSDFARFAGLRWVNPCK